MRIAQAAEFAQLLIDFFGHFLFHFCRLFGGFVITTTRYSTHVGQFVGQLDRVVEGILAAAVFGLVQLVFDLPNGFVDFVGFLHQGLHCWVFLPQILEVGELFADVADVQNGLVRLTDFVPNGDQKVELLPHVLQRSLRTWVFEDFKLGFLGFATYGQPHAVLAGNRLGASGTRRPKDHAVKTFGIRIAHVPVEGVTPFFPTE